MNIKKTILSVAASVLAIFSTTGNAAASSALNDGEIVAYSQRETIPLRIYDYSTKISTTSSFVSLFMDTEQESYSSSYFPSSIKSGISTNAIVGDDNRVSVSNAMTKPYSATCYLRATFKKSDGATFTTGFSGFLIGPNLLLTCGHGVYHTELKQMSQKLEVFPAMNGSNPNYISSTLAKRVVCSEKYISNLNYENDWAIVELNENIGYNYGWLGIRWNSGSFVGTDIWNTGYPSGNGAPSWQNVYGTRMALGKGRVLDCGPNFLRGAWDATGGNSGGPVFAPYSYGGYDAVGILTCGSPENTFGGDYMYAYTQATRFTRGMYDLFMKCKNSGISSL